MEAFLDKAQELTSTWFLSVMFYIFIFSIVIWIVAVSVLLLYSCYDFMSWGAVKKVKYCWFESEKELDYIGDANRAKKWTKKGKQNLTFHKVSIKKTSIRQ